MSIQIAERMENISPFYVMELLNRAKELEAQGRDIIHLEIGEPDFLTPERVVEAGMEFIRKGQVKYTPAAGLTELREKIADYYLQRYACAVDKERIFVTPGASGAFMLALGVWLNPGDEVLISDPGYPCNSNFISLYGGAARLTPVDASTGFQLNGDLIRRSWTERTKGVLVTSPSNPTGTVIAPRAFEDAIRAADELGGCFISDEIYHGLEYGERSPTALAFSDNCFVINSFSKYFGMTGWRIGWLVAPESMTGAVEKLAQNIFISSPAHSQYAALAAFGEVNMEELQQRCREFESRRDFLYRKLLDLGFEIPVKPEGAFYIYADCRAFTRDSFRFAKDLLEAEGVAITPGRDFGRHNAESYVRFAYTTSIERMDEGILRLKRFINR